VVVHSFWRKREREGRLDTENGFRRASPSTAFRNARTPRIAPETPGEAQKRPRLRALQNAERRFHLAKMVEETAPMNKHSPSVDELPSSGMSAVCSARARSRTLPPSDARGRPSRRSMEHSQQVIEDRARKRRTPRLRRHPSHRVSTRGLTLWPTEGSTRPCTEKVQPRLCQSVRAPGELCLRVGVPQPAFAYPSALPSAGPHCRKGQFWRVPSPLNKYRGFRARRGAARPHVWGAQKRRKARELHDKNRPLWRRSLIGERRFEA
jgi:hypothetical protein